MLCTVCLLLLTMSVSVHVAVCNSSSFILNPVFCYMNIRTQFIYLFFSQCTFVLLLVFGTINNAAGNILVPSFVELMYAWNCWSEEMCMYSFIDTVKLFSQIVVPKHTSTSRV